MSTTTGQTFITAAQYSESIADQLIKSLEAMFNDGAVTLVPPGGGDFREVLLCSIQEAFQRGAESVLAAQAA